MLLYKKMLLMTFGTTLVATKLRMRGCIPHLPYTRPWRGQGDLYLYNNNNNNNNNRIMGKTDRLVLGGRLPAKFCQFSEPSPGIS